MPTPLLPATRLPPWLAHVLRAQRGPVPWNAVLRGALAALPLLAAVLAERPTAGVPAALGAMLAGINDRPGSRRASVARLGLPALAGSAGLLCGSVIAETAGDGRSLVVLPLVFGLLGLGAGAISSTGPVASACGTQVLVAVVIGAGMPLPEPGSLRALLFLAGAGWLLLLRLVLPSPGGRRSGPYGLDGEREAVAAVYEAAAELLLAVGGPRARAGRAALSAALDQAQDALTGPRLRRFASSAAERRLHAQYAAAFPWPRPRQRWPGRVSRCPPGSWKGLADWRPPCGPVGPADHSRRRPGRTPDCGLWTMPCCVPPRCSTVPPG